MTTARFPPLNPAEIGPTKSALHAYSRVLGAWLKQCRPKRKHWWHASLRPSLNGLTTGVVSAGCDFELELDLRGSALNAQTASGVTLRETLEGQPAEQLAARIREFLRVNGIEQRYVPTDIGDASAAFPAYSERRALALADALASVASALAEFRAGIKEETSPIQLWPHHFDLAMLWLPGDEVPGQDPADEEQSDQQMNFGFTFGDHGTAEPYFYVTAYPEPDGLPAITLPDGARWHHEDFSGAVLHYRTLVGQSDPRACLLDFWTRVLAAGRELMQVGSRASRS
jgi:Family of unknown function (DUF5996)